MAFELAGLNTSLTRMMTVTGQTLRATGFAFDGATEKLLLEKECIKRVARGSSAGLALHVFLSSMSDAM